MSDMQRLLDELKELRDENTKLRNEKGDLERKCEKLEKENKLKDSQIFILRNSLATSNPYFVDVDKDQRKESKYV